MADPLSAVADRFVPPRTNFLDPAPGQSIIARYGNAGIGLDDSNRLAESAVRLRRSREDRLGGGRHLSPYDMERQNRQREIWHREDADYAAKKDLERSRGDFLKAAGKLDPHSDDYDQQRDELLTSLPKGVMDDDAFRSIMTSNDSIARERRSNAEMDRRRDEAIAGRRADARKRAVLRATEAGIDPKDFPRDPITNEVDEEELMYLAGGFKRQREDNKIKDRNEEYDRRQAARTAAQAAEHLRKDPIGKDVEAALGNLEVFPTQMNALQREFPKLDDATLKKKVPDRYRAAREYDSKQLEAELGSAFNRKTADEYVNLVPGLTEDQKQLRRKVWEAAHKTMGDGAEEPTPGYGNRPDGTPKGKGWLGELKLPDGGVATEYTMQSQAVQKDGKQIDFPTLVPTLSKEEVDQMVNDIIPNRKDIPEPIIQKAIQHAKGRIAEGKSVFADESAAAPTPATPSAPPLGFKSKGYVFTGGNPADKANWKKE